MISYQCLLKYVPNPNPVKEVYIGMKGSHINGTFEVIGKRNGQYLVREDIKMIGREYSYECTMLAEDILRLCDDNKGSWK
jgi:hypothetical protein